MKEKVLLYLFMAIYFFIFYYIIDMIFKNSLSVLSNILSIACLIIAFIISAGLADFTVKKIFK